MKTSILGSQRALGPLPIPGEFDGETSAQPRWLTDAVADDLHRERGTVERVAIALHLKKPRAVYAVADRNDPKPLKAAWIPAIVRETGSLAVLNAVAAQCDCVVFKMPANIPNGVEWQRELAACVSGFGAYLDEMGEALANGTIERHELPEVLERVDAVVAVLAKVRAMAIEQTLTDAPPAPAKASLR